MTFEQAVEKLKKRYNSAKQEESGAALAVHLFGIEFGEDLSKFKLPELAEQATGYKSYATEIKKGMNISPHVSLKG